jgi:hypothetical protein
VALATLAGLRAADERWPERTGREAARRALEAADLRRIAAVAAAVVTAAVVAFAIAAGDHALHYADRHTTAVLAALGVAAMSAVLPAWLVILGARRPSQ